MKDTVIESVQAGINQAALAGFPSSVATPAPMAAMTGIGQTIGHSPWKGSRAPALDRQASTRQWVYDTYTNNHPRLRSYDRLVLLSSYRTVCLLGMLLDLVVVELIDSSRFLVAWSCFRHCDGVSDGVSDDRSINSEADSKGSRHLVKYPVERGDRVWTMLMCSHSCFRKAFEPSIDRQRAIISVVRGVNDEAGMLISISFNELET